MHRPTTWYRLAAKALLCGALGLGSAYCARAGQIYSLLSSLESAKGATGRLSIERAEGGLFLLVVQLAKLPAPERIAPGLTEFAVWLLAPGENPVKAGALKYDRAHRSGSLFATTNLPNFTVQVTGERDRGAATPSDVLLAERTVTTD